jgi:hypothetical protein
MEKLTLSAKRKQRALERKEIVHATPSTKNAHVSLDIRCCRVVVVVSGGPATSLGPTNQFLRNPAGESRSQWRDSNGDEGESACGHKVAQQTIANLFFGVVVLS